MNLKHIFSQGQTSIKSNCVGAGEALGCSLRGWPGGTAGGSDGEGTVPWYLDLNFSLDNFGEHVGSCESSRVVRSIAITSMAWVSTLSTLCLARGAEAGVVPGEESNKGIDGHLICIWFVFFRSTYPKWHWGNSCQNILRSYMFKGLSRDIYLYI